MPFITNQHSPTTPISCHSSIPSTSNRSSHKESSVLTENINSASCCSYGFEDTGLTAILSAGKNLRLQAESLQNDRHVTPIPQAWKCGLLTRCLLGVGILTGAGILGYPLYRYSAAREQKNATQPEIQPSIGQSENLLSHQTLQDTRAANRIHSRRHIPEYRPAPSNNSQPEQQSKNKILHKENHTWISSSTKKVNRMVIKMLRGNILPKTGKISRAKLLYAVSVYLFHSKNGITDHACEVTLLACNILSTDKRYPAENHQPLSLLQAKSVIRNWVFQNILGKSLVEFITQKMKKNIHSPKYTLATVHHFLSVNHLPAGNHPHYEKLSEFEKKMLLTLWHSFLNDEMPFLRFNTDSIKHIHLDDYVFASLYTGSRFLATVSEDNFSAEEAISTGEIMWDLALQEGVLECDKLYYRAPAIFFEMTVPDINIEQEKAFDIDPVNRYIQHRKKISNIHNDIKSKYDKYITTTKKWYSKSQLRNNILSQCISHQMSPPLIPKNTSDAQINNKEKPEEFTSKVYLKGMPIPCNNEKKDLDDKYKKLTNDVADSFREIDKYIILTAIRNLSEDEQKFISSPDATVHRVEIRVRTRKILWNAYGAPYGKQTTVPLKESTDLISVHQGQEKRIYSLRTEMGYEYGYRITRIDREMSEYLDSNIIDYFFTEIHENDSKTKKQNGNSYYPNISQEIKELTGKNNNISSIISFLSNKHRDFLYQSLYESGNGQYNAQKTGGIIKHMFPFYDCVEDILNNDPIQTIPSCLMNAVKFIPDFGTAVSLNEEFSFEPITDISKIFSNRVVNLMSGNNKTATMAQKIASSNLFDTLPEMPAIESIPEEIIKKKNSRDLHNNKTDDSRIYVKDRNKRGIKSSKLCPAIPSCSVNAEYTKKKIIGKGSISTVYDLENGYVEKVYNGYFTEKNKSRLISAKNNAKGFNRYYGKGSATVKLNHEADGKISVSVKLKKINGQILSDISSLKESNINTEMISKIASNHPEEYLSRKLQEKGIIHHDINKGNIIYNKGDFFIIDFDSANFLSNGKKVSKPQTKSMKNKLKIVFNEVLREIK